MKIDSIIKSRRTQKVLADEAWEVSLDRLELQKLAIELLEVAASAPYHHKCNSSFSDESRVLNSCLPYRFYILDTDNCRDLATHIGENNIKSGKVINMLFSADLLFLVTWLPETNSDLEVDDSLLQEPVPFHGSLKNMEHIAAASSAIQNILIASSSRGIPSYWSSGGVLRKKPIRELLEVPLDEILLGALFLFPKDSVERSANIIPGHLRDEGKKIETWSKWVNI